MAGSALLGLAKIKKQLPSRFRSSLAWGCLIRRMLKAPLCMAGCSELLLCRMLYAPIIPMQDASSSFFAGCLVPPHVSKLLLVDRSCLQPFLLLMLH